MILRDTRKWVWVACVVGMLGGAAFAQDQGGGEQTLQTPRNNVKGGTVAARRPGLWIQSAKAVFQDRQSTMLDQFGGATPIPADQKPPSLGKTMKIAFLQGLFDMLNKLADQLLLAIQASHGIVPQVPPPATNGGT